MTDGRRPHFWRDPRWWVSVELGLAIVALATALFVRIATPGFIGGSGPDTTPLDVIAALGLAIGFAWLLRIATQPDESATSYLP
jgi:hypothetical protein